MPAEGTGKTGIVHLFGGVFVGAAAEEMCRNWRMILQSSGIDHSVAPTAPASVDVYDSSARADNSASPTLPTTSHLTCGASSSSEEGQRAAGKGEEASAGGEAITGVKRYRATDGYDVTGARVEGDGCTSFVSECSLPTDKGLFRLRAYRYNGRHKSHEPVVMVCGDVRDRESVPVRVHDQCQTSEVCMHLCEEEGGGVI